MTKKKANEGLTHSDMTQELLAQILEVLKRIEKQREAFPKPYLRSPLPPREYKQI